MFTFTFSKHLCFNSGFFVVGVNVDKTFFARLSEEEIVISKNVKHNFKQVMVYAVHNDKLFSSYSGFLCEIKIFSLKSIL
jgi:hypothetical protein